MSVGGSVRLSDTCAGGACLVQRERETVRKRTAPSGGSVSVSVSVSVFVSVTMLEYSVQCS